MKNKLVCLMVIWAILSVSASGKEVRNTRTSQRQARLRKNNSKKDCSAQEVLLAIDDMFVTEDELQDTDIFKSTVFDSKAIYEEVITQELTEIYEYFALKDLQLELQVDSKNQQELTLTDVYIRNMYNSYGKKSTMLSNQGQLTLKSFKLYVMRQQIYSTIKMVSILTSFDYTLRYNNLDYSMVTVSQRFFQVATEYMRLAQIDRLLGKGVMLQISEQINQLIFSNTVEIFSKDKEKDSENMKMELNNLQMTYQVKIQNVVDTLNLQLQELDLVQRIQYQYDVYAQDSHNLFSKDGMKAVAQTLSEMLFKDIKVCHDFNQALSLSKGQESKFIFQSDSTLQQILEITDMSCMMEEMTVSNINVLSDYASYLMTQTQVQYISSRFYDKNRVNNLMAINNFDKYSMSALAENHSGNQYVANVVGVDQNDIHDIQMTLYSIQDFLHNIYDKDIFPEEIRMLFDFTSGSLSEKILYPTLAAFVHLKQGYDNFLLMATELDIYIKAHGDEMTDKLEYIELQNLFTRQIKNQQIITNQKMKLLKYELYQDLMAIVVEVRNYAIMYQSAVLSTQPFFPKTCKKAFNEQVLLKLKEKSQEDILRFQERFRYVLNNFFLRQVNVIANVKALTELMMVKSVKLFYAVELLFQKLQQTDSPKIGYLYLYNIETTAMWKQVILYKQSQSLNKVYLRFMLHRYKPYNQFVQKYISSPFSDFMNTFNNGYVTKQDIFRIDNALMGDNGLEMEQVGNRVSFLELMQKHKCALISIYKEFQLELAGKYSLMIKTQINYQNLIQRIRQSFYMYVSDIEIVPVDVNSENYYNSINQLKVMGYDEFILQSYAGNNALLKELMTYKQMIDGINIDQAFRLFYCQGCFNRQVESMVTYEYSEHSYQSLLDIVTKKTTDLKSTTTLEYFYEVNMLTYFNTVKQTENVVYLVKYYTYVNKFKIIFHKIDHKSTFFQETITEEQQWIVQNVQSAVISQITINLHCVLDRFQMMLKKFSIYSSNIILKTQNSVDSMTVKNIIDTVDNQMVEKYDQLNMEFIGNFHEMMTIEYEGFIKHYDSWSYDYDYKYGKYITENINNVVRQDDYNIQLYGITKYFVFTDRKLVYNNYMNLVISDILANQLVQETSALYAQYLDKNFIADCLIYHVPECIIGEELIKEFHGYVFPETESIVVDTESQRKLAQDLFKNEYWRIGQSRELGKIFSKVINLLPNYVLKTQAFSGKLLLETKFTNWAQYSKYVTEQSALSVSNVKNGMNNLDVGIYSVNDQNQLSVKLYSVNPKDLKFYFNSFSIYNDDIRYNIVQDMLKTAFMFPYRLTNDNIRDNQVDFLNQEETFDAGIQVRINQMQQKMNEVFADNDYYGIYVGEMSEAIEKDEFVRIFVDKDQNNCYTHQAQVVSPAQENMYDDIIDNDYVITEVVYYFEQERREQYFQDMLAVNYNDPFYQVLYQLGFRYVSTSAPDNDSVQGFYDFDVKFNEETNPDLECTVDQGFEWLEKSPPRGMKRVWVRSKMICTELPINNNGAFFLTTKCSCDEKLTLEQRQTSFLTDFPVYAKTILPIIIQQYTQTFIDMTWDHLFQYLDYILVLNKQYLSLKMLNPNVYMIDDYNGSIQNEEPTTSGRGQLVLLTQFFRFTQSVLHRQTTYFSNKEQEKMIKTDQNILINQVAGQRNLHIYQFDTEVTLVEVGNGNHCAVKENPNPKCLGMTTPLFEGYAADMQKENYQKQITVFGICGASYSGFLNYAMYEFVMVLFNFNANECSLGFEKTKEKVTLKEEKTEEKKKKRLRKTMLSSLSSGKYNHRVLKTHQIHAQQQKRLLKKTKHNQKLGHMQLKNKTN